MIRILKKPKSIKVQVYISPILYENSEILSSVELKKKKSISKNNPSGIINGPLSESGEELENPMSYAYDCFIDDCKFCIETSGCRIICSEKIDVSDKSEHILLFGKNNKPCGKLIFSFMVSEHPLKSYKFSKKVKKSVAEYLKMNKVMDGTAFVAGIDFYVKKVLVGHVKKNAWYNAIEPICEKIERVLQQSQNFS